MRFEHVLVVGAAQMGGGIAQVVAAAGRRGSHHHPVPGPVERTKLLGMATKIGVGESLRFLRKQRSVFARIAAPGFSTDRFVSRVAALATNEALGIEGLHVFTFNQVEVIEAWRRRMLEEAVAARSGPR